jgi:carboxylesterase type B
LKELLTLDVVVVWIYGGGFTIGNKDDAQYDPAGLILQSETNDQEGVIVIKVRETSAHEGILSTRVGSNGLRELDQLQTWSIWLASRW